MNLNKHAFQSIVNLLEKKSRLEQIIHSWIYKCFGNHRFEKQKHNVKTCVMLSLFLTEIYNINWKAVINFKYLKIAIHLRQIFCKQNYNVFFKWTLDPYLSSAYLQYFKTQDYSVHADSIFYSLIKKCYVKLENLTQHNIVCCLFLWGQS